MKEILVKLKDRSYKIAVDQNSLNSIGSVVKKLKIGDTAIIITSKNIKTLYGNSVQKSLLKTGIETRFELVSIGEKAKSVSAFTTVINNISTFDVFKKPFIIALGGGTIGDLAGFVASVYKRGIPYLQIPTTLLAQVDSSIGGKVAIDLPSAKNMVGSFYQPKYVLVDVSCLKSLSKNLLIDGLGEVVKYGIIESPFIFENLEKYSTQILNLNTKKLAHIVYECAKIKARIVEKDEFDKKDKRIVLNLGHTIGHAIETAGKYNKYTHGNAVSLGIIAASYISKEMNILSEKNFIRICNVLRNLKLKTKLKNISIFKIIDAYKHDKKFINKVNRLVLPVAIGKVKVVDNVPDKLILQAMHELIS